MSDKEFDLSNFFSSIEITYGKECYKTIVNTLYIQRAQVPAQIEYNEEFIFIPEELTVYGLPDVLMCSPKPAIRLETRQEEIPIIKSSQAMNKVLKYLDEIKERLKVNSVGLVTDIPLISRKTIIVPRLEPPEFLHFFIVVRKHKTDEDFIWMSKLYHVAKAVAKGIKTTKWSV